MRTYIFLFLFITASLATYRLHAQTMVAKYKVTQIVKSSTATTLSKPVANLEFTGYLYRKGNTYIYFKKPGYLSKYASGILQFGNGVNGVEEVQLYMDTVQNICYKNFDSLLFRYRWDASGKGQIDNNFVQSFEPGFQQWQILSDTKNIDGLFCQKAILNVRGEKSWEVWFCADIPSQAGPSNIFELPGLVIEAQCFPTNENFKLLNYTMESNIPDQVFWPAEFSQPFVTRRAIKKASSSTK